MRFGFEAIKWKRQQLDQMVNRKKEEMMKLNWISMVCVGLLMTGVGSLIMAQENAGQSEREKPLRSPVAQDATAASTIRVDGGKIVIIAEDGTKQEIEIPEAKSITVTRSVQSSNVDGVEKREYKGQAVLIGPDGKRTVIEIPEGKLSGLIEVPADLAMKGEDLLAWAIPNMTDETPLRTAGQFFIGVVCEPVDGALRAQLKLDDNVGLIVQDLTPESPAEQAGIQKYDILLYADQNPLSSVAELSKAVELAGKEQKTLRLSLIRTGTEQNVEVTPRQRESVDDLGIEWKEDGIPGENEFLLRNIQPGIIRARLSELDKSMAQELREQLERMRDQIEASRKEMGNVAGMREELDRARAAMDQAREEMRKSFEEMRKALQEEQKRRAGESDNDGTNPQT